MERKLYGVFHEFTVDGGYGDAIMQSDQVGLVFATDDEIEQFVKKYDKPIVYDHPYDDLVCHHVSAYPIEIANSLDDIHPYGEGDYLGKRAKEWELRNEFKEKYGDRWWYKDGLNELFAKELEKKEENAQ